MSNAPTAPNPSIARLIAEGFEIDILHQHLLVHSIPYLDQQRNLKLGTLVCPYVELGDQDTRPADHTMWLQGDLPHMADGRPMSQVVNHSNTHTLFDQFQAQHYLSNKNGEPDFPTNFYDKVAHYHILFVSQARVLYPNADGRTGIIHPQRDPNSVFRYPDTASARAGITAVTQRLAAERVAIVGTGGTGSYILDLLAKTPIKEVHLFDGDDFEPHTAFRAPGAASLDNLQARPKKVDYLHEAYDPMRRGIIPHPYHLEQDNVNELAGFNFVFVAVDNGPSRKLIADYLVAEGIPFIDVGMGVEQESEDGGVVSLSGTCRVTLATADKHDHLQQRMDFREDQEEVLYRSNIQVADLNALNAALAVLRWKQFMGFYSDQQQAHNLSFSLSLQSLGRAECPPFTG
ncbi:MULTISPECIES: ThiF family adenylyltransferase [Pseudomonas]|uniref:ThiF family adenylyltransferase n=1 Tax=Pseudomonas TaxID=286 RepID=UPI0006267680|nr:MULTISPECIES: ThiF family adenylyltransferase [Pseudomonas]MBH1967248.1 ThiF family adenylyltransferase [Pseudomonadales bacterium]MBH2077022.1 ThiF family adenylyltransferase [Pseudomonadales bacterium]